MKAYDVMEVGDLVNNVHAPPNGVGLGLVIKKVKRPGEGGLNIKVKWLKPLPGIPEISWMSEIWLEKVNDDV